ncbi:hypothetical protein SPAR_07647, partial [Streptomyces sparsogenes DSM 40356]
MSTASPSPEAVEGSPQVVAGSPEVVVGIDIATAAVRAVCVDARGRVLAEG